MRQFVKALIGTGKNIILVAHVIEDKNDETGQLLKRPLIPTGLKDELVNMVDVVGYFDAIKKVVENEKGEKTVEVKRFLNMRPGAGHIAKDRTGKLGDFVKPD
jgi:hypothetical protein